MLKKTTNNKELNILSRRAICFFKLAVIKILVICVYAYVHMYVLYICVCVYM